MGPGMDVPDDYFFVNASAASVLLRQKILKKCREDIYDWLNHENGQVAIYDAVNPLSVNRRTLAKEFANHDVQVRSNWHATPNFGLQEVADFIFGVVCYR
jgi:6-phosphofructo-2-kinase / fructose-2,6-biphosphatase 4